MLLDLFTDVLSNLREKNPMGLSICYVRQFSRFFNTPPLPCEIFCMKTQIFLYGTYNFSKTLPLPHKPYVINGRPIGFGSYLPRAKLQNRFICGINQWISRWVGKFSKKIYEAKIRKKEILINWFFLQAESWFNIVHKLRNAKIDHF